MWNIVPVNTDYIPVQTRGSLITITSLIDFVAMLFQLPLWPPLIRQTRKPKGLVIPCHIYIVKTWIIPKWPLTSTKNNRDHAFNMADSHTKYEISHTYPTWDIVFTSKRYIHTHTYTHTHTHILVIVTYWVYKVVDKSLGTSPFLFSLNFGNTSPLSDCT